MSHQKTFRQVGGRAVRLLWVLATLATLLALAPSSRADSPLPPGTILRLDGRVYLIADPSAPLAQPVVSYASTQPTAPSSPPSAPPPGAPTNPLYLRSTHPLVMEAGTYAENTYWEPQSPSTWGTYNGDMSRFFSDIGGSGYYGNLTQYYDNYINIQNHSESDGNWQDTQHYPASAVYDQDIANEVQRTITQNSWPIDSEHQFNIFLGTNSSGGPEVLCTGLNSGNPGNCTNNSYVCSYHNSVGVWDSQIGQYVNVAYTAIAYGLGYNNGCKPPVTTCPNGSGCNVDAALQWLSHETFEVTSDPFTGKDKNGNSTVAWQDLNGQEIADKCQTTFSGVVSSSYNHTFNGHNYILQDEWNNSYTGAPGGGTGGNCSPYGPKYP